MAYVLTPDVSANASYRYRDVFGSGNGLSKTVFVGADYTVHKNLTLEARVFRTTGDINGTGIQLAYVRGF